MRAAIWCVVVGLGLSLFGCTEAEKADTGSKLVMETGQHAQVFKADVVKKAECGYLLYLPKDYGKGGKQWPLMLFLHGAGERGDDINKVKVHGPPKLVEQGKDMPFIIISPQCPAGDWWPNKIDTLTALVEYVSDNYAVDKKRIYLTGLSMGGYGSWSLGSAHPEMFAAVVPICGGGQPISMGRRLKSTPVWAFHGAKDSTVPLRQSEEMVEAINRAGGDAKLTVYPEAGHDSWTATYDNPELYEWLLSHSK